MQKLVVNMVLDKVSDTIKFSLLNHFILEPQNGVLAESADPYQMPHNVASGSGLLNFASVQPFFSKKNILT